jgi:hypothetical protein
MLIEDADLSFQDLTKRHESITSAPVKRIPYSAYWKIENEFFYSGGFVYWDKFYRIRHIQTGRYLEMRDGKLNFTTTANKSTLFSFQSLKKTNLKSITKDDYLFLKHMQTGLYLGEST